MCDNNRSVASAWNVDTGFREGVQLMRRDLLGRYRASLVSARWLWWWRLPQSGSLPGRGYPSWLAAGCDSRGRKPSPMHQRPPRSVGLRGLRLDAPGPVESCTRRSAGGGHAEGARSDPTTVDACAPVSRRVAGRANGTAQCSGRETIHRRVRLHVGHRGQDHLVRPGEPATRRHGLGDVCRPPGSALNSYANLYTGQPATATIILNFDPIFDLRGGSWTVAIYDP
jgi:hypothetical protein